MPPRRCRPRSIACCAFWDACRDGAYHERLEPSSDAWGMARQVHESRRSSRIRVFLSRTAVGKESEFLEPVDVDGVEIRGRGLGRRPPAPATRPAVERGEPIEIDFVEHSAPTAVPAAPDVRSRLPRVHGSLPGRSSARSTTSTAPGCSRRNVRSFLQATGKVNRGIRDTIAQEPGRFLAYNNGIQRDRLEVELVDGADGGLGIATSARPPDRQRRADHRIGPPSVARTEASTSATVAVQAKITEVEGEARRDRPADLALRQLQNKVTEADLRVERAVPRRDGETLAQRLGPGDRQTQRDAMVLRARPRTVRRRPRREPTPLDAGIQGAESHSSEVSRRPTWRSSRTRGLSCRTRCSRGAQKNFASFMLALAHGRPSQTSRTSIAWSRRPSSSGERRRSSARRTSVATGRTSSPTRSPSSHTPQRSAWTSSDLEPADHRRASGQQSRRFPNWSMMSSRMNRDRQRHRVGQTRAVLEACAGPRVDHSERREGRADHHHRRWNVERAQRASCG